MQLNFIVLFAAILQLAVSELIQVFVLFRHGARTPLSFFWEPNQYNETRGELTPIGRQQVRDLGKRLRQRYVNEFALIDGSYNPHQVYVKSSNKVRTNHSTYHLLEGLFPDTNPGNISVSYVSTIRDLYFHGHQEETCSLIGPILTRLKSHDDFDRATAYYREKLFPNIVKAVNKGGRHNISVDDLTIAKAKKIFDGYKCNIVNGKTNPVYTEEEIELFYKLNLWHLYKYKFGSDMVQKITNSPVFQDIDKFLDCTFHEEDHSRATCPRLVLFSAHDSNIVPFLRALLPIDELLNNKKYIPPFASDLLIEVHQDAPHHMPWIRILYNDEPLHIWGKGKSDKITLVELQKFLQANIFEDIAGICDGGDINLKM